MPEKPSLSEFLRRLVMVLVLMPLVVVAIVADLILACALFVPMIIVGEINGKTLTQSVLDVVKEALRA